MQREPTERDDADGRPPTSEPRASSSGGVGRPATEIADAVIRDFRLGNQAVRNMLADPSNPGMYDAALQYTTTEWIPSLNEIRDGLIRSGLRLGNPVEEPPLVVVEYGEPTGDEVTVIACEVTPWDLTHINAARGAPPVETVTIGPVIVHMRHEEGVWKRMTTMPLAPDPGSTCADFSGIIPFEV
jgi:hypothetical protein